MALIYAYTCRVCAKSFLVNTERSGAITCPKCSRTDEGAADREAEAFATDLYERDRGDG